MSRITKLELYNERKFIKESRCYWKNEAIWNEHHCCFENINIIHQQVETTNNQCEYKAQEIFHTGA